jgi:transposase-like protein
MFQDKQFKTILDLIKVFPDERTCHQYLASQKWDNGVIECPHCEHDRAYVFKDGIRYKCKSCKIQFTAKTNTFMEASNLPTIKWLMGMYLVLHKKGISSIQLGKDVGVTQKTGWFMLQRIRNAFGNEETDKLSGVVEIDETFVGGKARFKHKKKRPKYNPGRGWKDKTPVLGMLEREEYKIVARPHKVIKGKVVYEKIITKPSELKASVISDVLMLTIKKAVLNCIEGGSTVYGDGFNGYRALHKFYEVKCVDHGKGHYVDGDCHTNTIEGAWSQFKRSIYGTYIQVSRKHLNKYVNEFVFRYNCRNLTAQQQIEGVIKNMHCRLTYKELIKKAA